MIICGQMGFKCYLCKRSPDKVGRISLHRFPNRKNYPHIFSQWVAVCDLKEEDDVQGYRICSSHFREEDKLFDYALTKIRSEAIPSINVKKPEAVFLQINEEIKKEFKEEIIEIKEEILRPPDEKSLDLVSTVKELWQNSEKLIVANLSNMDDLDKYFELLYSCLEEKKICTTMSFRLKADVSPMEHISVATFHVPETRNINETLEVKLDTEETGFNKGMAQTPDAAVSHADILWHITEAEERASAEFESPQEKRRFSYPRYISEIQIMDVSTPQGASRVIEFVKQEDQKKTLKIKSLDSAKRYLKKRVASLEGQLANFKKQGIIPEDAVKTLVVKMSCLVRGCCNSRSVKPEGISFHRFPKMKSKLCEKWLGVLDLDDSYRSTSNKFICSLHFKSEDFYVLNGRHCLKETAVPVGQQSSLLPDGTPRCSNLTVENTCQQSCVSRERSFESSGTKVSSIAKCRKTDIMRKINCYRLLPRKIKQQNNQKRIQQLSYQKQLYRANQYISRLRKEVNRLKHTVESLKR